MKARNLTREQVVDDVLRARSRPSSLSPWSRSPRWRSILCGDDAAQITGSNLSIDGGWTAA